MLSLLLVLRSCARQGIMCTLLSSSSLLTSPFLALSLSTSSTGLAAEAAPTAAEAAAATGGGGGSGQAGGGGGASITGSFLGMIGTSIFAVQTGSVGGIGVAALDLYEHFYSFIRLATK